MGLGVPAFAIGYGYYYQDIVPHSGTNSKLETFNNSNMCWFPLGKLYIYIYIRPLILMNLPCTGRRRVMDVSEEEEIRMGIAAFHYIKQTYKDKILPDDHRVRSISTHNNRYTYTYVLKEKK